MPNDVSMVPPWPGASPVTVDKDSELYKRRIREGYTEESAGQKFQRARTARLEKDYGPIEAGAAGLASGASIGLSDWLISKLGGGNTLANLREANPTVSTTTQIAGAAIPALLSGGAGAAGAVSRGTLAGRLSAGTTALAESQAGRGFVRELAAKTGAAALEAGTETLGHYVGDSAIYNKPITAEGAASAFFGGGALGGAFGGALTLAEKGTMRLRRLFPDKDLSKEAVKAGQAEARKALTDAIGDADKLDDAARTYVRSRTSATMAADPEARALALEARAIKNRELLAKAEAAEGRNALVQLRLEKAKAGPPPRQRRAKTPKATSAEDLPVSGVDAGPAPLTPQPLAPSPGASREIEDAVDDALAAADPRSAAIIAARKELAAAKGEVANVLSVTGRNPRDVASAWLKQADANTALSRAKGKVSREDDVLTRYTASDPIDPNASAFSRSRERQTRMRDPYTNEELVALSKERPTFYDVGRVEEHAAPKFLGGSVADPVTYTSRKKLVADVLEGKVSPHLQIEHLAEVDGKLTQVTRRATAEDVIAAARSSLPDIDEAVIDALRNKANFAEDLAATIPALTRFEAAEARLVDALGDSPSVPAGSAARAAEWRAANDAVAAKEVQRATDLAAAMSKDAPAVAERTAASDYAAAAEQADAVRNAINSRTAGAGVGNATASSLGQRAADIGTALELLNAVGVDTPSLGQLPVIGPVLRLYLLARTRFAAVERVAGKFGVTAEMQIARKSAEAQNKMRAAVRNVIAGTASGVARATRMAPAMTAVLSRPLFSDDSDRYRPAAGATMGEMWARRENELRRATMPGVLAKEIRAATPQLDPDLQQALIGKAEQQAQYLLDKIPKPPPTWSFGGREMAWRPPDSEVAAFARIVEAVRNPAEVISRMDTGDITVEQIEAIRSVYPLLYAEAQVELLTALQDQDDVPYERRVQLGTLFGVPLDPTQEAAFGARQQEGFAAPPSPPPPPPASPQPSPGVSHPITLSKTVAPDQGRSL